MKETLEEAAERFLIRQGCQRMDCDGEKCNFFEDVQPKDLIEFAKWQAERTKETIFDKVDYKLLAKQKMLLIELSNTTNIDGLDGLIYFLDAFQDEAVDMHGKVFALEGGQDA